MPRKQKPFPESQVPVVFAEFEKRIASLPSLTKLELRARYENRILEEAMCAILKDATPDHATRLRAVQLNRHLIEADRAKGDNPPPELDGEAAELKKLLDQDSD